jgi:pimeloyl-ACP methyl ester carboxylesterase
MMRMVESAPVGELVDVQGRRLWCLYSGMSQPAVIFLPGAGGFGLDFFLVHEQMTARASSLLYDRAGTGWSVDVSLPRSTDEVTNELRVLVQRLDIPSPYLLVGHSLGGAYVQRYAQRFPHEVAGMLLLDPLHENWDDYQPDYLKIAPAASAEDAQLPDLPPQILDQLQEMLRQTMTGFPADVREAAVARHASPDRVPTGFREGLNLLAVLDDLRNGGQRPNVPLIILSAAGIDNQQLMFATEDQLREQIQGSERLYDALTAQLPRSEHRTITDASHATLPMARPDAVADAVFDLMDRIGATHT